MESVTVVTTSACYWSFSVHKHKVQTKSCILNIAMSPT